MNTAEQAQKAKSAHSRARELDTELRSCVRQQIALDARIAVLLAELQQGKLWRQLNCTSLTDYGRKFLGYSSSKTSDLLQIGQRDDLPELLEAMEREKAALFATKEGRYLYRIEEALRRLYNDPKTFGTCHTCGAEVGYERLDALPHARYCIDCKTKEEGESA